MARPSGTTDKALCADYLTTTRSVRKYLCAVASPYGKEVNMDACRKCESQCNYGRRYLELFQKGR